MSSPEVLLRRLTRNLKATRSLLRHLICAPPPPLPSLPCSPPLSFSRRRLLSPLPGLAAGSLFLSSPAWKLSQSATPLHFQGNPESFKTEASPEASKPVGEARGAAGNGGGEAEENSVWNLPNLISISRMISGPVIGWMIIHEWYFTSFVSLAVSGMTDWLDGFVARKMNINSVLGSYLDPLADKVLIGCVAVAMVKRDLLHPGVVLLVVVRDVGLVGGAVYKRASTMGWQWRSWYDFANLNTTRPEKVEPLFISKVNTVFQLILVATALLQPDFGSENTEWCITYLSWLVASTTVASSIAYGVQHLRRLPA